MSFLKKGPMVVTLLFRVYRVYVGDEIWWNTTQLWGDCFRNHFLWIPMKQLSGVNGKCRKVFWFVCHSNERSNFSDLLPQKGSWGRDMGPLSQGNLGWWNMKIWPAKHLNIEWLEFQVTWNHGPFLPQTFIGPFGYCSTVPTTGQWKRAPRCLGSIRDYTVQLYGDHDKPL